MSSMARISSHGGHSYIYADFFTFKPFQIILSAAKNPYRRSRRFFATLRMTGQVPFPMFVGKVYYI